MSVIDVYNDPYSRKRTAGIKRVQFEKLKRTEEFRRWKRRQMRIQHNKCAYCKIPLTIKNIVTHIDHINPLYYEGTNDFDNLVLSCRKCNLKKWVNNRVVKPEWVKNNEDNYPEVQRLSNIRGQQKKLMKDLVNRELDEKCAHWMKTWL